MSVLVDFSQRYQLSAVYYSMLLYLSSFICVWDNEKQTLFHDLAMGHSKLEDHGIWIQEHILFHVIVIGWGMPLVRFWRIVRAWVWYTDIPDTLVDQTQILVSTAQVKNTTWQMLRW